MLIKYNILCFVAQTLRPHIETATENNQLTSSKMRVAMIQRISQKMFCWQTDLRFDDGNFLVGIVVRSSDPSYR